MRVFVTVASAICLLTVGIGWGALGHLKDSVAAVDGLGLSDGDTTDGAVDLLVVGTDNRADAHGNPLSAEEVELLRAGDEQSDNTDTILLIRIPNNGDSATALSIPRDTYIQTPELGKLKINGVFSAKRDAVLAELIDEGKPPGEALDQATKEGRNALIEAIRNLTGVEVDHYSEIGLLGFVLLTDAVDGVEICLKNAVYEPLSGANFPEGTQTLRGSDALSFVRQRHGLPAGDLDRIVRQQAFMSSLTRKILSSGTLKSPAALQRLSQAASRSVVTDSDWDIVGLAMNLKDIAGGQVRFKTIPVTSIDGIGEHGESVVTVNRADVHRFVSDLAIGESESSTQLDSTIEGVDPATITATVLNATSVDGLASAVSQTLAAAGYQIGETTNAPAPQDISEIRAMSADDPATLAVAQYLGGLPVTVVPSIPAGTVEVVLGSDYDGPTSPDAQSGTMGTLESMVQNPNTTETAVDPALSQRPIFDAAGDGPTCVN